LSELMFFKTAKSFSRSGYTLISVKYDAKVPSIEKLCNNDSIKYISDVTF